MFVIDRVDREVWTLTCAFDLAGGMILVSSSQSSARVVFWGISKLADPNPVKNSLIFP